MGGAFFRRCTKVLARAFRVLRPLWLSASILALAGGCQQFFTTSLAKPLARQPATLSSITADQAAALVAAKPDQALAASAVGALASLVTANPTSASVVSDAAQVAVTATGLDTALTQALSSIDLTTFQSGGTLSTADATTLSSLLTTAASNVNTNTTTIFDALATQAAADPSALAAGGTTAQTLIVAAAAIAINDANTQLAATNQTVADVINKTATYAPSGAVLQVLTNLANGVNAIDPGNPLLSTLQSTLNITL